MSCLHAHSDVHASPPVYLLASISGSDLPPRDARREIRARIAGKRCRVFVAEDNDNFLRQLVMRLKVDYKARVETAKSGENAIEAIKNAPIPFDLILMDIRLLGLDGITVYDAIREAGIQTKVLFMSGFYDEVALQKVADRSGKILHKETLDYTQIESFLLQCRGDNS